MRGEFRSVIGIRCITTRCLAEEYVSTAPFYSVATPYKHRLKSCPMVPQIDSRFVSVDMARNAGIHRYHAIRTARLTCGDSLWYCCIDLDENKCKDLIQ
jgi:hypothetical protein